MDQTVLLIAKPDDGFFRQLEEEIFKRGFQTLTVRSLSSVRDRLDVEMFATIVLDVSVADNPREFTKELLSHPFGAVAPIVIIAGENGSSEDLYHGRKTILDQVFLKGETSPSGVAEYLAETLKDMNQENKRGELGFVKPPDIFVSAGRFALSGAISFINQDENRIVFFEDGVVTFASSTTPEDFFGEFLVDRGAITVDQLKEALSESRVDDEMLGDTLVRLGMIKADQLFPLLEEHIKRIIFRTLAIGEGRYVLRLEDKPPHANAIFKLAVNEGIYQGVKQYFTTPQLRDAIGDFDQRYKLDPLYAVDSSGLYLEDRERDVLRYLREPRSVNELLQLSALKQDETLRLIYIFIVLRVCLPTKETAQTEKSELAGAPIATASKQKEEVDTDETAIHEAWEPSNPEIPIPKEAPKSIKAKKADKQPPKKSSRRNREEQTESSFQPGPAAYVHPTGSFSFGSFSAGFISAALVLVGGFYFWNFWTASTPQTASVEPYSFQGEQEKSIASSALRDMEGAPATAQPPVEKKETKPRVVKAPKAEKPVLKKMPAPPQSSPPAVVVAKATAPVVTNTGKVGTAALEELKRRAEASYEKGKLQNAKRYYDEALRMDPEDGRSLVGLANIYFDLERDRDALIHLKKALQLDRENADAYLVLGNIRMLRNQPNKAASAYRYFLKYSEDTAKKNEVRQVLARIGQ